MAVLQRIAYFQGRRDEQPNQALAEELAAAEDREGIREIVAGLHHEERGVRSDCIKVLYEVGYRSPELIADYVDEFLALLRSRENRLVWGGMIALSTIAALRASHIFAHRAEVQRAMEKGSVITVDAGVETLATVAAQSDEYRAALLPYLLAHLARCRPKDVPRHAEKVLPAVDAAHREEFIQVLEGRMRDLARKSQVKRVEKVLRAARG